MEQHETKSRVAQPAEEEIKKHGDQLARQVDDAAGKRHENQLADTNKEPQKTKP